MEVLVIFSDPPGQPRLRLDREDSIIAAFSREFGKTVHIERQHASELGDVHDLITNGGFDVIQFSGHGNRQGIYLDKKDLSRQSGELVSTRRLLSLLQLADKQPTLVLFLCCYSHESIDQLANAAPFVITTHCEIGDEECLCFVKGFYERFFKGFSVESSFNSAISLLRANSLEHTGFRLSRRSIILNGDSMFVSSNPMPNRDSILINLDAVKDCLPSLGIAPEQLAHLISRKLAIHNWIFDVPRDRAIVPIGHLLFGEFSWINAKDVVHCQRLMKLKSDVSRDHWALWAGLLVSYNDMASSQYRSAPNPAAPDSRHLLEDAVELFQHNAEKYLVPARLAIASLGYNHVLPNLEFALAECRHSAEQLALGRFPQAVQGLELCLTNYHEVVDALQPPEEQPSAESELGTLARR